MIKKLCLLLCALPPIASSQQTSSFHFSFDQPFGNYPVGFRVVEQYDRGRPALADSPGPGRPLQTLIWYPANADKTPPMTLGDFEDLIARETSFDAPTTQGRSQDFVHAFMHGTEPDRTVSLKDAKPQGKKFPVVVYAPSINAPNFENIELCEYLASYGFVVIASPSMGASNRHMEVNPNDAHAQAADILFLLAYAKTLNDADSRETAVIGYSWAAPGV